MNVLIQALMFAVMQTHAVLQDGCFVYRMLKNVDERDETDISVGSRRYISDDNLMPDWYSIPPGTRLSTSVSQLKIGSCGTYFPIWINGTHPIKPWQEVTGCACRKTFNEDCDSPFAVTIKNCRAHYVYYLKNTPLTSAYCMEFYGGCKFKTTLPDSVRRGTTYISKSGEQFVSDDAIVEGWYYVASGTRLATQASGLETGSCGTLFPIWLNGTHPSIIGETLKAMACMKTNIDICDSPFPLKITNCGSHYVYYLRNTTLNSAFCMEKISKWTSDKTTETTTDAIFPPTTSALIIATDIRGNTLPHPRNDTYFGDDSVIELESFFNRTTVVFSAVILCPVTVLLVILLFKLKTQNRRLVKVRAKGKEMKVFFIPMNVGWMKATKRSNHLTT